MKKIVIASACRTAIGKFGGTLANVPAAELGISLVYEAGFENYCYFDKRKPVLINIE